MLIEYFQISSLSSWKSRPRRGDSSKDYAQAVGSTRLAEVILPKITPKQLEEQVAQRQFFQRLRPSIWKYNPRRGDSSKYHASTVGRSCLSGWNQQPCAVQMSGELTVVESGIVAVPCKKLVVAALFHYITVIQHEDVVSAFDR